MVVRVSIDVPALRGVVTNLNDFVDTVYDEWTAVAGAGGRGLASPPSLNSLGEHTSAITDSASNLQARIDLAILYNTGDDGQLPSEGVLTYELSGSTDSIQAVKEQLGRELAETATRVYPFLPDEYRQYTELVERYKDDGAVTSAFYQELGPEGALRVLAQFADDDHGAGLELADQKRLLDAMKASLHSATDQPGFPNEWFANGMVEAATRDPNDLYGRGPLNYTGALSFLLYDSHYNEAFTRTVVEGLDNYERVEMDGDPGWLDRPDMGVDFSRFFPWEAGTAHADPLISAMTALENNPELALEFFSDTGAGADDDTHTRVNYYIKHRDWRGDGFRAISGVLDAATTDPSLISDATSESAKDAAVLASRTVEFMAQREDFDEIAETITWDPTNPASENFAHILTTYMVGVDHRLQHPDNDVVTGAGEIYSDAFNGRIANVPTFSTDGLRNFALLAMASDEGFAQLRTGLNEYRGTKLGLLADSIGLTDPPSDTAKEQLRAGIQQDAALEGFFIEQIGESRIAEGAEKDARIEAWVDFGAGVIDAIPIPGVGAIANETAQNFINLAIDTGKGHGYDAIKEALATHEEAEVRSAEELATTTLQQQEFAVAELLADRGLAADPGAMSNTSASNGQIIDYATFAELNDQDQALVLSEIFSSDLGVGDYFNLAEYEGTYKDMFEGYFRDARG